MISTPCLATGGLFIADCGLPIADCRLRIVDIDIGKFRNWEIGKFAAELKLETEYI
jgi:hypothetical protein